MKITLDFCKNNKKELTIKDIIPRQFFIVRYSGFASFDRPDYETYLCQKVAYDDEYFIILNIDTNEPVGLLEEKESAKLGHYKILKTLPLSFKLDFYYDEE